MLGLSLHGWENVMLTSLALAAVFAAVVGISTYCVVQLQRQEISASKDEFEIYKLDAGEKIAGANSAGEAAKADAAQANARAIESQLVLERFKAPRNINSEQQRRVAVKVAQFAGTPFDLEVNPSPEPIAFMQQIILVLNSAGWKWLSRTDTGGLGVSGPGTPVAAISGAFVGLGIAIDNGQEATWLEAVTTLANALAAEGINIQVNTKARMPPDAIHIVIGTKQ